MWNTFYFAFTFFHSIKQNRKLLNFLKNSFSPGMCTEWSHGFFSDTFRRVIPLRKNINNNLTYLTCWMTFSSECYEFILSSELIYVACTGSTFIYIHSTYSLHFHDMMVWGNDLGRQENELQTRQLTCKRYLSSQNQKWCEKISEGTFSMVCDSCLNYLRGLKSMLHIWKGFFPLLLLLSRKLGEDLFWNSSHAPQSFGD